MREPGHVKSNGRCSFIPSASSSLNTQTPTGVTLFRRPKSKGKIGDPIYVIVPVTPDPSTGPTLVPHRPNSMGNSPEPTLRHRTMSPPHRVLLSPPPPTHTRPGHTQRSPTPRLALYLCCAAEVIFGFGNAVGSMPWTRLIESVICRRHAGDTVAGSGIRLSWKKMFLNMLLIGGKGGSTAEALCKGDGVQAEMAEL